MNFGQIGPLTMELSAHESLKISPLAYNGDSVATLFLVCLLGQSFFIFRFTDPPDPIF